MSHRNARPTTLNFITGNANKLAEVRAILGDVVDLQSKRVDVDEIQGGIEEIARDKAKRSAEIVSSAFVCCRFEEYESMIKHQLSAKPTGTAI